MRISTLQMHQQGLSTMLNHQVKLDQAEQQLASGLRILKPSDDPSGAVKVLNLTANIDVIDQFSRNVSTAEASLNYEESVVASVNDSLQRVRELSIQGNNSTYSDADKNTIAEEIYQHLDSLVALANTRDANGEYIFSGNQVNSPPFVNNGSEVVYQGDQGQRMVQIGEGSQVAVRDSGQAVFQQIRSGNGTIQVTANDANTGTAVIGQFGLEGNFTSDTYKVTFAQGASTDPVTYTVTDSADNITSTGTYTENTSISFAGAQFELSGSPADGDEITLSPSINRGLFETVKGIADALARPTTTSADKAQFHNDMAQGLSSLDQGLTNVNNIRAGIGARLNNIETLDEVNQDFKVQLQGVLSDTQDLDYAEAISRFNLQLTSLQAAQQAFVKTSGLSLFQYL